ncbi:MAG: 4Fe-4S dicluster domain-containing protein [Planctomycetaceae bacterium]|nr:4Fe-4S dicluster domain-containing protein [Planctomycetaceae bacterium]
MSNSLITGCASQVIFVNKATCRDCYRCVRVCPVKAIKMHDGQASIVAERCIACGTCVRECPQSAKKYRQDLDIVKQLLASGDKIACSLAPAFAGFFTDRLRRRIPSVLRLLGFSHISETAVGAFFAAQATAQFWEKQGKTQPLIISACPACVEYILHYQPQYTSYIAPVVSPMVAHAKYIRKRLGNDTKVVFIGPCIAKKVEGENAEGTGFIDAALTFEEFSQWLEEENIDVASCEESGFDDTPRGAARYFPLEGGCIKTAGWSGDRLDEDIVAISGIQNVQHTLESCRAGQIIEPLFCPQGCICGPGSGHHDAPAGLRHNVIEFSKAGFPKNNEPLPNAEQIAQESRLTAEDELFIETLTKYYRPLVPFKRKEVTEAQIREVYEKAGKTAPEDFLNCSSCGYHSCRDLAIAVIEGLASPEMCVPFFRKSAEQRIDRIIETSPNGIVTLDEHLNIVNMNPTFRQFFRCSNAVCGRPISYLMDPEPWERLLAEPDKKVEIVVNHEAYNLICSEVLWSLPAEKQFVGIFMNITTLQKSETQLDQLRRQTVKQARELLEQQVQMAETIAISLGENTARAESLLEILMDNAQRE